MKKSVALLLLSVGISVSPVYPLLRPALIVAGALNSAHTKPVTETLIIDGEEIVRPCGVTPDPFVETGIITERTSNGNPYVHAIIAARMPNKAELSPENFNHAHLAFCGLATVSINAFAKSVASVVALPKTVLGKTLRRSTVAAASLYTFNQYEKINEIIEWNKTYTAGAETLSGMMNEIKSSLNEDADETNRE